MMARKMTAEPHQLYLLHQQFVNPYGNVQDLEDNFGSTDAVQEEEDFMSPLPPQLKGTFVDKLPSFVNSPADTFLNVTVASSSMGIICILTFFVKSDAHHLDLFLL